MEKHSPSQKGISCRFYPKLCPWSNVFPDKPSSDRLLKRIFLEQKKLKHLPLSQPMSAYCRNSTGVSDTEEVQLHKEELGSCIKNSIRDL